MNDIQSRFKNKIHSITMLRGIACLAICFIHFTGTVESHILNDIGRLGGYFIPAFFTISGFIIPFSLDKSKYKLSNYFKFLTKILIRLQPPFIGSLIGIFVLSAIAQFSEFSTSQQIPIFTSNTIYNLFYLVDFTDGYWLNLVYWTLAIELQFYIVCGLIFFFLNSKNVKVLLTMFIILSLCSLLFTDDRFIMHYSAMFLPGIVLFWYISLKISRYTFLILIAITFFVAANAYELSAPISAIASICFILFIKTSWKPLIFIGDISYSLYLIHTIVGTDGLINFMQNYITDESERIWLMYISLPIVIGMAWVFYLIIEKPTKKISSSIKYEIKATD